MKEEKENENPNGIDNQQLKNYAEIILKNKKRTKVGAKVFLTDNFIFADTKKRERVIEVPRE